MKKLALIASLVFLYSTNLLSEHGYKVKNMSDILNMTVRLNYNCPGCARWSEDLKVIPNASNAAQASKATQVSIENEKNSNSIVGVAQLESIDVYEETSVGKNYLGTCGSKDNWIISVPTSHTIEINNNTCKFYPQASLDRDYYQGKDDYHNGHLAYR